MPLIRALDVSGIFWPIWRVKEAKGEPIGSATAETIQTLRERAEARGADYVVACCDSGRSFRHAIGLEWQATHPDYKGYKGHRPAKDPAMMAVLDRVIDELVADGVPVLRAPGFEADDVIATVTEWAIREGHDVEIATEDKDLMQLVRDGERRVTVVRRGGEVFGPAEVAAKFGVPPKKLGEYLAIVGDSSDHVPGVRGFGDKAARAIITEYGGYAAAVKAAREEEALVARGAMGDAYEPRFTPAQRAKLIDGEAAFLLSLRLTTLRADVPVDLAIVTAPRTQKERPNKTPWREMPAPETASQETVIVIEEKETTMPTENQTTAPPSNDLLPPLPPQATDATVEPVAQSVSAQIVTPPPRQIVRMSPEQFKLALEPQTYEMARTVAEDMFDSGLFAVQRVQAALAIIQVGRAHGLSAVTSLMEIHMIEGKPQLSAKLMLALVRKSGKADYFKLVESSPQGAKWKTHRRDDPDPDPVFGSFTIDEARRALLGGISSKEKGNLIIGDDFKPESQYAKYPEDMCVWRAAARLIRREYSDVIGGLYAAEEMDEYAPTTPYSTAA